MSSRAAANGSRRRGWRAETLGHGQAEHRPDALAAGQQRVAHGLDERPRRRSRRRSRGLSRNSSTRATQLVGVAGPGARGRACRGRVASAAAHAALPVSSSRRRGLFGELGGALEQAHLDVGRTHLAGTLLEVAQLARRSRAPGPGRARRGRRRARVSVITSSSSLAVAPPPAAAGRSAAHRRGCRSRGRPASSVE